MFVNLNEDSERRTQCRGKFKSYQIYEDLDICSRIIKFANYV